MYIRRFWLDIYRKFIRKVLLNRSQDGQREQGDDEVLQRPQRQPHQRRDVFSGLEDAHGGWRVLRLPGEEVTEICF
jgi:hypothetical protein